MFAEAQWPLLATLNIQGNGVNLRLLFAKLVSCVASWTALCTLELPYSFISGNITS